MKSAPFSRATRTLFLRALNGSCHSPVAALALLVPPGDTLPRHVCPDCGTKIFKIGKL